MKQCMYRKTRRVAAVAFISTLFSITVSTFPITAAADVVRVQTNPLIPGAGSCLSLTAYGFTPYIYDGELHSFEFTVPDRSYVALAGKVGDKLVPFQFMTRYGDTNVLRVHVDVESTPVQGLLPISVTLVSAKGGQQAVCMSTVIMTASLAEGKQSSISSPSSPQATKVTSAESLPLSTIGRIPQTPPSREGTSTIEKPIAPTPLSPKTSLFASIQNNIVKSCATEGGTVRLWIFLLAIFVVITGIAALPQIPSTYSKGQRVTTILIPLILLFVLWYSAESCQSGVWTIIAALIIAGLGILSLYWGNPAAGGYADRTRKLSGGNPAPQKPSSNSPMITPPPATKTKDSASSPTSQTGGATKS